VILAATTAGNDVGSMAYEEHLHSEKVLADPSVDPARFVYMRNMPSEADWRDEKNWYLSNPALGDFKRIQSMRDMAKEAESSPAKQNKFRQLQCNQWVRQFIRWIDLGLWDANAGLVDESKLRGRPCWAGLDLASTADFAAWVLLFPFDDGHVEVLARFFLPASALDRRSSMRDRLEEWRASGVLTITGDKVLDYDGIRAQIDKDASAFDVTKVGYDRWNANDVVAWMEGRGLEAEGIPQTHSALNAPSLELERLLGNLALRHGGNPILRWMADNVQASTDSSGRIKPDKKKSSEKIDGIVALVMAIWCSMQEAEGEFFAMVVDGAS
jgi:phage terminase large subunit-like protein